MSSLTEQITFIDLFCGCGGFSLGMERAGLHCLAALDFNPEAIAVFKRNFPHVPHVLEKDIRKFDPSDMAGLLQTNTVDVIVGGPPCQGFSNVRQTDGANHGKRLVDDPRRDLYVEFLRYVDYFRPKVFVMENVPGIRSASNGEYFIRVQKQSRRLGYRVHSQVQDCVELGLPQKRRRQLFIGTRLDLPGYFHPYLEPAPRACDHPTLWEAIGDLPPLQAGEGDDPAPYDMRRRMAHVQHFGRGYLYGVAEVDKAPALTAHVARPHGDRDLRDFRRLREGESSAAAMRRGVAFEFPYKKHHFKDRYTRQSRWAPCSTIVAHLSKDGLMFIHPTQDRSLTPREAARVQSFPDWFLFPVPRTHQFRLIGNAVPPLVGEAIGIAVTNYIRQSARNLGLREFKLAPLPKDEKEAIGWLRPLLDMNGKTLRTLQSEVFKRAWYSIAFLLPGLHPHSTLENGSKIANDASDSSPLFCMEPRLANPYYEQSGWPVILAPMAREAWRRYGCGDLRDEEFYCSEAQVAGMLYRRMGVPEKMNQPNSHHSRRKGQTLYSVEDRLRQPHIMAEMLKLSLNQSAHAQKDFLNVLERLARAIRDMLENAEMIHRIEIDHCGMWRDVAGKVISFVDGGMANLASLGSEPVAVRVGSYTVIPGATGPDRETFRMEKQFVTELFDTTSSQGVYDDLFEDISKLREAARICLEAAAAVQCLENKPKPDFIFLHGALVNPVSAYADEAFPAFSQRGLEIFLPPTERHRKDREAKFVSVYLYLLKKLEQSGVNVASVVERASNSVLVCSTLLKNLKSTSVSPGPSDLEKVLNRIRDFRIPDALLFHAILNEGEYLRPVAVDRNIESKRPQYSFDVIGQYPLPHVTYVGVGQFAQPLRVEFFEDPPDGYETCLRLVLHSCRLMPNYSFPAGLDIVDKFARVPNWMSRPVNSMMAVQLMKKAIDTQNPKMIEAAKRLLCGTKRDWLFRPNING